MALRRRSTSDEATAAGAGAPSDDGHEPTGPDADHAPSRRARRRARREARRLLKLRSAAEIPRHTTWELVRRASAWNLVVAFVLGAGAAAASTVAVLREDPVYHSEAVLIIDNPPQIAQSADDAPLNKLNLLRFKYSSLASTAVIVHPVAQALGVSDQTVYDDSVVTPSARAFLLVSSANAHSPALARRMADGVASAIVRYVQREHEFNNVPAGDRFRFVMVDAAHRAEKVKPTGGRAAVVGAGAGLVAVAVVYVLLQLATARRRLLR